jgi:WD40 repeat protein
VISAAVSQDQKRIVTGAEDSSAQLWDFQTGKPIGQALVHDSAVENVSISADGKYLLTCSRNFKVRLWDAESSRQVGKTIEYKIVKDWNARCFFSPNGKHYATWSLGNTVQLWNIQGNKPLLKQLDHLNEIHDVVFSPDSRYLATASADKKAFLWDVATGSMLGRPININGDITCITFSPFSDYLYIGTSKALYRLDVAEFNHNLSPQMLYNGQILSIIASPDGKSILVTHNDHTARLIEALTGVVTAKPLTHPEHIFDAEFSPDGTKIITGCADGIARLWDALTGNLLGQPLECMEGMIQFVDFSSDGTKIICQTTVGPAVLWEAFSSPPSYNGQLYWSVRLNKILDNDHNLVSVPPNEMVYLKKKLQDDDSYAKWHRNRNIAISKYWIKRCQLAENLIGQVYHLRRLMNLEPDVVQHALELQIVEFAFNMAQKQENEEWEHKRRQLMEHALSLEPTFLAKQRTQANKTIQDLLSDKNIHPVTWSQAVKEQGKVIKVVGQVKQTYLAKKGELIILNFGIERIGEFCVVVPVKLIPEKDQRDADIYAQKTYVGKSIIVTGLVEFYEPTNTPQITIDSLNQLIFVEP